MASVVSDYYGILSWKAASHQVSDKTEAARVALEAGVDIELPDPDSFATIVQLVKDGKVSEAVVDRAVARNLKAKFLLGLFENPLVDPERAVKVTNSQAHRELAAEAARRSIVLLKNEKNLLPLDRNALKSIAIIGPNADRAHLGGYSDNPGRAVSVLQGITDKVGSNIRSQRLRPKLHRKAATGGRHFHLSDPVEDRKPSPRLSTLRRRRCCVVGVGGE